MAITPLMPVYPRSPVRPVRGEGAYLFGEQGERYLDFASGIAVNLLGHGHAYYTQKLQEQVNERSQLLSKLEQAKMQEKVAESVQSMNRMSDGATPNLDQVRDKIERRYANALGEAELAENSVEGRMQEVEAAGRQAPGLGRADDGRRRAHGGGVRQRPGQHRQREGRGRHRREDVQPPVLPHPCPPARRRPSPPLADSLAPP